MRIASLLALTLLTISISGPVYAESNKDKNSLYTGGMPNGRMWTEVSKLGDKQETFFKIGFVNGYYSGRSEAVIKLSSSDLGQEFIDKATAIMAEEHGYDVNDHIKYLDDFYSDSKNLKIPLAAALFCINRKHTSGNLAEFNALVTEYQKAW